MILCVHKNDSCCVMVRVLACDTKGRGFDSRPFRFQVTTLGRLFTHMRVCHRAVQLGTGQGAVMTCAGEVTVGLASQRTSAIHPPTGSRPRQGDELSCGVRPPFTSQKRRYEKRSWTWKLVAVERATARHFVAMLMTSQRC